MGYQSKINAHRRESRVMKEAVATASSAYIEGIQRATAILGGIEQQYSNAPLAIYATTPGTSVVYAFEDSFFAVASTSEEFHMRKSFVEEVANLTMSAGVIALHTGDTRSEVIKGRGTVRAWLVGDEVGLVPLPVTEATTKQLHQDIPRVAAAEHVAAGDILGSAA